MTNNRKFLWISHDPKTAADQTYAAICILFQNLHRISYFDYYRQGCPCLSPPVFWIRKQYNTAFFHLQPALQNIYIPFTVFHSLLFLIVSYAKFSYNFKYFYWFYAFIMYNKKRRAHNCDFSIKRLITCSAGDAIIL